MRGHTTHNLAKRLNLRRTGRAVSLALAALVVLFLAWLIFSTGGVATARPGGAYTLTKSVVSSGGRAHGGYLYPRWRFLEWRRQHGSRLPTAGNAKLVDGWDNLCDLPLVSRSRLGVQYPSVAHRSSSRRERFVA
jgi:hypothetical protein